MSDVLFLSRSALETYQVCPRLYYLTNHLGGRGVVPARQSLDLADGISRHHGVQVLNLGGSIDEAVQAADRVWLEETKTGIEEVPQGREFEIAREHRAIVEAGIRIWHAVRQPILRSQYDVVAVEKERSIWLKPGEVLFEGRPDCDLRSKYNQSIVAYSLKNPRQYYRSRHPDCLVDMQGRSELWLLGNEYGNDKMGGVLMDYVFTGKEGADDDDSTPTPGDTPVWTPKIRWTPMTRGWFKDLPDGSRQIAWKFKYDNPNYRPELPRTKENTKSKSFAGGKRIAAWEYHGGVKAWVDDLLAQKFVPTNVSPIDDLVFSPAVYFRQADQIVSFLFKLAKKVDEIQEGLAAVAPPKPWGDSFEVEPLHKHQGNFDYHFPQHETSCINKYGKKCRAWEICHGGAGRDPLANGFKQREPHHSSEAAALGVKSVRGSEVD